MTIKEALIEKGEACGLWPDEARAVAAVLAHAYEHDSLPPLDMVMMALGWRRNG